MRALPLFVLALSGFSLSGCVASAVADIVTAPVRVASKAVDLATTSQSEADEKRGRELRKREEELGKLERRYEKELRKCQDGQRQSCNDAQITYREMQDLMPSIPVEPEEDE